MRIAARWRDSHVQAAAHPEDQRGDTHQDARDPERDRRTEEPKRLGDQHRGEERPEVDAPIEHREDLVDELLVFRGELVADQRRYAGLDPARPQCNQDQACVEAVPIVVEDRQAGVPGAVQQRDVEDGPVLPQEAIGEKAPEQRREVDAEDEEMERGLGGRLALGLRGNVVLEQPVDEEDGEDVPHPVEAEPLARFVPDDERDLRRHPRLRGGHGDCLPRAGGRMEAP